MLRLKPPAERAEIAFKMAQSLAMVRHKAVTYRPVHYETGEPMPDAVAGETMWVPVSRQEMQREAAMQYEMLFASDGELSNFDFMVSQNCYQIDKTPETLLVRTDGGLMELGPDGALQDPSGSFVPNTLRPMLNTNPDHKAEVLKVVSDWLDSDEEAKSLLRHLATALAPHWSAVKYVLLLGEGRNGKGLLLKMMHALVGNENVSQVTRQAIAEKAPSVLDVNGKLLNLVYDGEAEYLKDSGAEKTLIAGEPLPIRRLYESTVTPAQTHALFVEGLNKEPKSVDKSPALQKRLVRYHFPNVFALDRAFEKKMLSEEMLGAFLALLIDHYVVEHDLAVMLAPTAKALELQLDHMYMNSLALQYLKYVEEHDTLGVTGLLGTTLSEVAQGFKAWRIKENDLGTWSEPDVITQLQPLFVTERKSMRTNGKVVKVRAVVSLKTEAAAFIESLKGEDDHVDTAAVVED